MAPTLHATEWLAAVTVLSFLEQAHFAWQVIYARRRFHVPPPTMTGPPEFERVSRAHHFFLLIVWMLGWYVNKVGMVMMNDHVKPSLHVSLNNGCSCK
uniref:Uncharacterized protein n=1 Tax=Eptatretus burgeri TaxID=7764 RepID=A0A8C4QN43_EPTBU